jgi:hypothetical protein
MNKENLRELKEFIEDFSRLCYMAGKLEKEKGINENHANELCNVPDNVLEQIMNIESEEQEEMGFKLPNVKVEETVKVEISKDKEKELIRKFGKKNMEKLAREMNFHGKLLNLTKTK